MKYQARNKKTGLPVGIFDQVAKDKMEALAEYSNISFEPLESSRPAPKPQNVKQAEPEAKPEKKTTRKKPSPATGDK